MIVGRDDGSKVCRWRSEAFYVDVGFRVQHVQRHVGEGVVVMILQLKNICMLWLNTHRESKLLMWHCSQFAGFACNSHTFINWYSGFSFGT